MKKIKNITLKPTYRDGVIESLKLVGVMWGVEFLNSRINHKLNNLGIVPRTGPGLIGVAASPFLHANYSHLIANSIPLVLLGGAIETHGQKKFWEHTKKIIEMSGAATWGLARDSTHVGASGLVFGYFGYFIAQSWYKKDILSIIITSLLMKGYSQLVFGALPNEKGVSWEAHLFGLLSGIISARSSK